MLYQPVCDVRIGLSESLGYSRGVALEQQHRSVGRIRQSAAENQLAAAARFPGQGEMLLAERGPPGQIIFCVVVEQQVMHFHKAAQGQRGRRKQQRNSI